MAAKKTASKSALKSAAKRNRPKYKRIVLKLSGESLQGPQGFGIHGETIQAIAKLGENVSVRRFVRFKVGEVAGGSAAQEAAAPVTA